MFLFFSILILACSKDSDLFSDTIEEQIAKEENNTGIKSNGFLPVDDEYTINAVNTAFLLAVLSNDSIPENVVVKIVQTTAPQDGELTINEDNVLSYTPILDDNKGNGDVVSDEFTYTVEITNGVETQQKQATVVVNTQYSDTESVKDDGILKAFPTAYGPGSQATGGRGKVLCIVNTLDWDASLTYHAASGGNDAYYTGGLLPALQNADVGYIIFNVSGDIHMGTGGWYDGYQDINNKTVFGQSAPQGGITLTDRSLRFSGRYGDSQNLIFRYIRSRPIYNRSQVVDTEDDAFTWAMLFYGGGKDIMVDHCSFSFAQDKALGAYIDELSYTYGLENITFQHNFIQDSHTGGYVEINPNRANDPEEYVDAISWHNNVFSSVNRTPNLAFNGRAEKINNVIHNTPYKNTSTYHETMLNVENNYYQRQGNRPDKIRADVNDVTSGDPLVYTSGNVFSGTVGGLSVNLTGNPSEDNTKMWSTLDNSVPAPSNYFTSTEHSHGFPNPVEVTTAHNAFDRLITGGDIGAYKYLDDNGQVKIYRDSFDSSQLAIVANDQDYTPKIASNWVLPNIPHNTRPESYDTDNDGMADAWEVRTFGNLSQSYRGDYDGDGYTNIEEYMNQVDF
ncbi:MAG: Ig-like domain-containing protein [Allomuricauda sp.]